jgi:hypothetical protein
LIVEKKRKRDGEILDDLEVNIVQGAPISARKKSSIKSGVQEVITPL